MTSKQKILFCDIALTGVTRGLDHPFEWLETYIRSLSMWLPEDKVAKAERDAIRTFVAFWRKTAPENKNLTTDQFFDLRDAWYKSRRYKA